MLNRYLLNFKNFPKEIWILAVVTLINRIGAVAVPFLSKYIKDELSLNYSQIGWVMVCFGVGSLVGTFLSGKLSDILGAYKVMVFSLFGSGVIFISLQFVKTFELLCFSVFLLTTIADMYRPAMMLSLNNYVSQEMRLKALSLLRAATNLGFVFGPLLGGFLIIYSGYNALLIVDGITCIVAILIFVIFVREKKLLFKLEVSNNIYQDKMAPFKDFPFILNWIVALITGYLFFQIFSIMPIYQEKAYSLTEFDSGMFLSFSGIILALFEISVVNFVQRSKILNLFAIIIGLVLMGFSYVLLSLVHHPWVFWIFMLLMSFGNMLTFTFASGFVMDRSHRNLEGYFMSIFQMSYGFAHVLSAKTGLTIIDRYDYDTNWKFNYVLAFVAAISTYIIFRMIQKEKENVLITLSKVLK